MDTIGTCKLISDITNKVCGAKLLTSKYHQHLKSQHNIQIPTKHKILWGFELTNKIPVFLFKSNAKLIKKNIKTNHLQQTKLNKKPKGWSLKFPNFTVDSGLYL